MYTYYTDNEPERLWVAVNGDEVVGFLAGCLDTRRRERTLARQIMPRFIGRLATGHYRLDRTTLSYALTNLISALRRDMPNVDEHIYPAHLHINLCEASRGLGLGKQLMQAYLYQLKEAGVAGVHLHTTSKNIAAIGLYKRFGFSLLDARPTRAWKGLVDGPVENQAYGLLIRAD